MNCSFIGRKAKATVPGFGGIAPDQDPRTREMVEQVDIGGDFEQAEQIGTAKRTQTGTAEDFVEPLPVGRESRPRRRDPGGIP